VLGGKRKAIKIADLTVQMYKNRQLKTLASLSPPFRHLVKVQIAHLPSYQTIRWMLRRAHDLRLKRLQKRRMKRWAMQMTRRSKKLGVRTRRWQRLQMQQPTLSPHKRRPL